MQIERIKVNMLGSFSVWVNGESVVSGAQKLTKPWQLFCYLLIHRDKFVSNRKLIAMLWSDDMLADPANVLKNAVYSLRKELCGGESFTDSPIIYSTGGYRFDPAVDVELDVDYFTDLCEKAAATVGNEAKSAACREAIAAYAGDFLPQLDQDLWVVPLALGYKRKYVDCVHALCEILWETEQFKDLLDVTSTATLIDPLDERTVVFLFRALEALKMYRVIVTTYSKVSQNFEDTLGGEPPPEAQKIFRAASERINKTEQDIIVIKTELSGSEQAARPQRGAYYCGYSTLRHMYSFLKRTAERNDQILVLALVTLTSSKNAATSYDITRAMAEFKVVAMNNLRKADAIARYSRNQFVMLLSVTSLDDGRLVRDRIRDGFFGSTGGADITIDVKLTEV